MLTRIGKFISNDRIQYTDIEIKSHNNIDNEIIALGGVLDILLHENKFCTFEEFHSKGEAFLYTDSEYHIKDFNVTKPFWILVAVDGFKWNLSAMVKIANNSNEVL